MKKIVIRMIQVNQYCVAGAGFSSASAEEKDELAWAAPTKAMFVGGARRARQGILPMIVESGPGNPSTSA